MHEWRTCCPRMYCLLQWIRHRTLSLLSCSDFTHCRWTSRRRRYLTRMIGCFWTCCSLGWWRPTLAYRDLCQSCACLGCWLRSLHQGFPCSLRMYYRRTRRAQRSPKCRSLSTSPSRRTHQLAILSAGSRKSRTRSSSCWKQLRMYWANRWRYHRIFALSTPPRRSLVFLLVAHLSHGSGSIR